MKKTIQNKVYNTDTATEVASVSNHAPGNDFRVWWEVLYQTPKGNWFLRAQGGPLSKHAGETYHGSTWGDHFIPMTRKEAFAWCEENDAQEAIENHFLDMVDEA